MKDESGTLRWLESPSVPAALSSHSFTFLRAFPFILNALCGTKVGVKWRVVSDQGHQRARHTHAHVQGGLVLQRSQDLGPEEDDSDRGASRSVAGERGHKEKNAAAAACNKSEFIGQRRLVMVEMGNSKKNEKKQTTSPMTPLHPETAGFQSTLTVQLDTGSVSPSQGQSSSLIDL